jgi:hypothetical protein
MTLRDISIGSIRIDGGTQARAKINEAVVAEYMERMAEGDIFPPAVVFYDGAEMWMAGGFHRYHATVGMGASTLSCDVREGTLKDAQLWAAMDNQGHGLPRTNADKRKAAACMLALQPALGNREIARKLGVSHAMVAAVRDPEFAAQRDKTREQSQQRIAAAAQSDDDGVVPGTTAPDVLVPGTTAPPTNEPARVAELKAHAAQLEKSLRETLRDNDAMGAVFDANDSLAVAMAENKKLRAQVSVLTERVNGLLNEKSAAVRQATSTQRKLDKAERELAALKVAAAV